MSALYFVFRLGSEGNKSETYLSKYLFNSLLIDTFLLMMLVNIKCGILL